MPSRFDTLVSIKGTAITYHKESGITPTRCPCVTPEGFRDPLWHINHPTAPVCNEQGFLFDNVAGNFVEMIVKGMMQPAIGQSRSRTTTSFVDSAFGELQRDDHIGFFPMTWNGLLLDFENWSKSGSDWVFYDNKYFTVVSANKIPDPHTNAPTHHWELALRLINHDPA